VSEWAAQFRVVSAESGSPHPGAWDGDRVPYLREVESCLSFDHPSWLVVFVGGRQSAKSEPGLNLTGHPDPDERRFLMADNSGFAGGVTAQADHAMTRLVGQALDWTGQVVISDLVIEQLVMTCLGTLSLPTMVIGDRPYLPTGGTPWCRVMLRLGPAKRLNRRRTVPGSLSVALMQPAGVASADQATLAQSAATALNRRRLKGSGVTVDLFDAVCRPLVPGEVWSVRQIAVPLLGTEACA
jgi:hypothetical protein